MRRVRPGAAILRAATIDVRLKEFASPRQAQYLDAVNQHGGMRPAARALGVNMNSIHGAMAALTRNAARRGYAPLADMSHVVPDGFAVRGVSTYYNADGKVSGQWVKSREDADRREAIVREAIKVLAEDVPRIEPTVAPPIAGASLCNVITLTDVHVGAYAWGKETGADWDLGIAERDVRGAVRYLLDASPAAGTCVIAQLGDFLHQDGLAAVTPSSGHNLDSDSRFSKVVSVAIRILRAVEDMALERHAKVVLLVAEGNHDIASSIWLRHMFTLFYEREPRVSVIDSELPFYVYQHGQTMLAWHHGHLKRIEQLPLLMAAQFPKIWGDTVKRYVHTGHLHHVHEKEHSGITVIQHPTIAARDAYAARGGWVANREMTAICYSDKFGQVARATVCPAMLA